MRRHTIKQTIDISIIQDFVLNERNIEKILQHIITKVMSKYPVNLRKKLKKQFLRIPNFYCLSSSILYFGVIILFVMELALMKLYMAMDLKIH